MLGYAFIILGAVFLLKNLNLLSGIDWEIVWPVAAIILGVLMVLKKK